MNNDLKKRKRIFRGYPKDILKNTIADARVIDEENAGLSIKRRSLGKLWGVSIRSSYYTEKVNNMRLYGLTDAKRDTEIINLTGLCKEIVDPADQGQLSRVLQEASLAPGPFKQFYELYESKKLPPYESIKRLVLEKIKIITKDTIDEFLQIVISNGLFSNLISEDGDDMFVNQLGNNLSGKVENIDLSFNEGINNDVDDTDLPINKISRLDNRPTLLPKTNQINLMYFEDTDLPMNKISRLDARPTLLPKTNQINLMYFENSRIFEIVKSTLNLLGIEFSQQKIIFGESGFDFDFIKSQSELYSIFILNNNNLNSENNKYWMHIGMVFGHLNEKCIFIDSKSNSNIEIDDLDSEVLKIDDDNISESKLLLILRLLERNIIEVNIK